MLQSKYFQEEKNEDMSLEQQGGTIEERIEDLLELKSVKDDSFNPVNFRAAAEHAIEKKDKDTAKGLMDLFTEDMTKALDALIEKGPTKESDVPSKSGLDELIKVGMVITVAGEGGEGKLAAATTDAAGLYKTAGVEIEEEKDDEESEEE